MSYPLSMEKRLQDYKVLRDVIILMFEESQKSELLPKWLYNLLYVDTKELSTLKEDIHSLFKELLSQQNEAETHFDQVLLERLDLERYYAKVHLEDDDLRTRVQDAMLAVLFFTESDIEKYKEYVLAEQDPEKFIHHMDRREHFFEYKNYLLKQHAIYGRLAKNFSDEEITLAAKGQMINGLLLQFYGLHAFLKHGFQYTKRELKTVQINKIEKGYLTIERINSYMEKIGFLMHPANELQQDPPAFVQNARYLLEDIINAAGLKEPGKPAYPEHKTLIKSCYWVDEMFKVAAADVLEL